MDWKEFLRLWKRIQPSNSSFKIAHIPVVMNGLLTISDFKTTLKNGFRSCALVPFGADHFNFPEKLVMLKNKGESFPSTSSADSKLLSSLIVSPLESLEKTIPRSILTAFRNWFSEKGKDALWMGLEFYGALYESWRQLNMAESVKICAEDQHEDDEASELTGTERRDDGANSSAIDGGNSVLLLDTIPFVNEISLTGNKEAFIIELEENVIDLEISNLSTVVEESSLSTVWETDYSQQVQIVEVTNECDMDCSLSLLPVPDKSTADAPVCDKVTTDKPVPDNSTPDEPVPVESTADQPNRSISEFLEGEFGPKLPPKKIKKFTKRSKFIPVLTDISWILQKEETIANREQRAQEIQARKVEWEERRNSGCKMHFRKRWSVN